MISLKSFNLIDRFWEAFSYDLAVDLGTSNTLIFVLGKGVMLREPTVVAAHKKTKQIIAVGSEAKKMLGKTPLSIIAKRPLKDGVIHDIDLTEGLLKDFIQKIHQNPSKMPKLTHPKVAVSIPNGLTAVDKRAVEESVFNSGARKTLLIESLIASFLGMGLPVEEARGNMVVDIGGGTTEIGLFSLGGLVASKSIRVAGDEIDEDIVNYIRVRYNILIGQKSAEHIKIIAGSAYPVGKESNMEVRGMDLASGLPVSITIGSGEIREAISNTLRSILEAIKSVIEEAPPELIGDVAENGIYLSGGGSLLKGLPNLLAKELKMPVILAKDPMTCVVRGAAKILENKVLREKFSLMTK